MQPIDSVLGVFRPTVSASMTLVVGISGCGYGIGGATPDSAVVAPQIVQQPADQSVPMGLSATYSVTATGTRPTYQWTKNGVAVPGATASSYVTPVTAFTDTGSSFSVVVANTAGTASSTAASLTVTARAPMAGDLRFQQVDAASTVNGYVLGATEPAGMISGLAARSFMSSIGSALWVGTPNPCITPTPQTGPECLWTFRETAVPAALSGLGLTMGYASDTYSNLTYDLADPNWPGVANGISPASTASVCTSLDLELPSQLFAVSWIQSTANPSSAFDRLQGSVSLAALQAALAQEGSNGRVITAVSYNGSQIEFLSYGWSADPGTVYEATTSVAPPAQAPAAAAALAAAGYIITATGLADGAGDVLLIGTRVQGDTLSRPFIAAQSSTVQSMAADGFATVGVIVDSTQSDPYTYLGER